MTSVHTPTRWRLFTQQPDDVCSHSNQMTSVYTATRWRLFTQQPDDVFSHSNQMTSFHRATRWRLFTQQPDDVCSHSNQMTSIHTATRWRLFTQQPDDVYSHSNQMTSVHTATRWRAEVAFSKYWDSKFLIRAKPRVQSLHAKSTDWQIFFLFPVAQQPNSGPSCLTVRCLFIHSSSLSYDRSKASSKASSPYSAIQSVLFQMKVSFPFLKAIQ